MEKRQFDPLWEAVGEKVALQGQEPDYDALCPECHVKLHIGARPVSYDVKCGLCGAPLEVVNEGGQLSLKLRTTEE